jgi:hypothetical protein
MYDHGIIGPANYKAVERVCAIIQWSLIARKYGVKKKCKTVLKHLASKGYVDLHGKAGNVASLTKLGVDYVLGRIR